VLLLLLLLLLPLLRCVLYINAPPSLLQYIGMLLGIEEKHTGRKKQWLLLRYHSIALKLLIPVIALAQTVHAHSS
jgi:hypothetical protein